VIYVPVDCACAEALGLDDVLVRRACGALRAGVRVPL